jgi:hypothetical protein
MDIQKAFDSVSHDFLILVLENAGFGPNFISWIKLVLLNQQSSVFNGGESTGYFNLGRGCRQGDPISAYLFILVIEVFFTMVRKNNAIEGLKIFNFEYKLTSYADDSSFFIKNIASVDILLDTFKVFSEMSGLILNEDKCEIATLGKLRGDQVTVRTLKCIDLTQNYMKILGISFSYNKSIYIKQNFSDVIEKIHDALSLWKWRNLSLIGKITIFKTMAFSKIVYVSFLSSIPSTITNKVIELQDDFIWDGKRSSIKHNALINDYPGGGLKKVDVKAKFQALRMSWIKRLYTGSDHPWKYIPKYLLENKYPNGPFYPNMKLEAPSHLPIFTNVY